MPTTRTRTISILVAVLIAGGFIGTAFYLTTSSSLLSSVTAQSTDELLREYAALDSDGDGLPDWQEALYGTDPHNPESVQPGMTDAEAVRSGLVEPLFLTEASVAASMENVDIPGATAAPNSLTDRFSRLFFEQYLSSRQSREPSAEEMADFVTAASRELVESGTVTFLSTSAVVRSRDDAIAAGEYVRAVDAVLLSSGGAAGKDELDAFRRLMNGETSAAAEIISIADVYRTSAEGMRSVSVPPRLASAHAEAVSAIYGLGESLTELATFESDPLLAFVALGKYAEHSDRLRAAFITLSRELPTLGHPQGDTFFENLLSMTISA